MDLKHRSLDLARTMLKGALRARDIERMRATPERLAECEAAVAFWRQRLREVRLGVGTETQRPVGRS